MSPVSLEGQTLGKYRVLEPLGHGGMARVYRAYHPQLDRYVAIKVLRSDLAEDAEFLARFRREAQAVAALRHPNVVQVFDFDVENDLYYMVMELLEGDTLKTRLNDYRARNEQMPLGEMAHVLLDVLEGLAYAHSEGMVHRDIKTANVLLTRRGEAVLADFGIAQIVGSTRLTISGALMGTLNYMAPEQGLKGESDARSDIYSLGIVFYEMLAQRTPFEADTPLAILMKHLNDPLPLPRQIDPTIPEPFERVVLKALAKDPADRYQSAAEMAQALRHAAEDAGVEPSACISLPLSFTTTEAPAEPVAVFSGEMRERISDTGFAADDTDTALVSQAEGPQGLRQAGREVVNAMSAVAQGIMTKTAAALRRAADEVRAERPRRGSADRPQPTAADGGSRIELRLTGESDGTAPQPADADGSSRVEEAAAAQPAVAPASQPLADEPTGAEKRPRRRTGAAIMSAIGLVAFGNLCLLTIAFPFNFWPVYAQGWPIQLFLVSWGLCLIMYVTSSIWMLIPVGIIFANGLLLTYSALTGNWDAWVYLWIPEVWALAASIILPILIARRRRFARGFSRLLALTLSILSIAAILFIGANVGLGSLIAPVLRFVPGL